MKVGITGHQTLGPHTTIDWLAAQLEEIITQQGITTGLTCLAVGADQLYAEALRKRHIPYIAVIPSKGYHNTFHDPNDQEKYFQLLQEAADQIALPFEQPGEMAYYAAGKKLVDLSNMMIAIWNGQPAKGLGGTGDIVAYARSVKKAIIHLNPITWDVVQL